MCLPQVWLFVATLASAACFADEEESDGGVSSKENRQQAGNVARLTQASPAAASATHDLDAQSAGSESIGLQSSVPGEPVSQEVPAAVTPVKASLAKSSGD